MTYLVVGLILFLGMHSISIAARPTRDALQARLGEGGWKGLYSIVALVGFVLIIIGYGAARQQPVVLYTPPSWLKHPALLLLLPVFPLLVSVYLQGHIKAKAKHPMLLATKLWAFAHLLANGTLADVLLFGGFLAWAIFDRVSVKRRSPASHAVITPPPKVMHDLIAIVIGLAIYAWFVVQGHQWLIGVKPL